MATGFQGSHREGPFSVEALRLYLHYDPETGIFSRKNGGEVVAGDISRPKAGRSYRIVWFRGRGYYAHRLAWIYTHGTWPPQYLDHINRDGADNRLCNLRLADTFQNMMNRESKIKNSTGFKGVRWCKDTKKFRATIRHMNEQIHLGFYDSAEAASKAYAVAATQLRGEFANLK